MAASHSTSSFAIVNAGAYCRVAKSSTVASGAVGHCWVAKSSTVASGLVVGVDLAISTVASGVVD